MRDWKSVKPLLGPIQIKQNLEPISYNIRFTIHSVSSNDTYVSQHTDHTDDLRTSQSQKAPLMEQHKCVQPTHLVPLFQGMGHGLDHIFLSQPRCSASEQLSVDGQVNKKLPCARLSSKGSNSFPVLLCKKSTKPGNRDVNST